MIRVITSLVIVLCATFTLSAQFDFDKVYGGANIGYASPTGDFNEFAKGGLTYTFVAGYKLTDRLAVGIEYGSAVTASIDTTLESGIFGLETYGLSNYFLRGSYKLLDKGFAPYVAVGVGLATVEEPDVTSGNTTVEGQSRAGFGADVELGINIKGVNLSYSYVIGGKTPEDPVFSTRSGDTGVSYHRFQVGYIYNF